MLVIARACTRVSLKETKQSDGGITREIRLWEMVRGVLKEWT